MTSKSDLPEPMKAGYHKVPDWAANVAFADALIWLAERLRAGVPAEITPVWLVNEASRTYDMAEDQWNEEGLYAPEKEES